MQTEIGKLIFEIEKLETLYDSKLKTKMYHSVQLVHNFAQIFNKSISDDITMDKFVPRNLKKAHQQSTQSLSKIVLHNLLNLLKFSAHLALNNFDKKVGIKKSAEMIKNYRTQICDFWPLNGVKSPKNIKTVAIVELKDIKWAFVEYSENGKKKGFWTLLAVYLEKMDLSIDCDVDGGSFPEEISEEVRRKTTFLYEEKLRTLRKKYEKSLYERSLEIKEVEMRNEELEGVVDRLKEIKIRENGENKESPELENKTEKSELENLGMQLRELKKQNDAHVLRLNQHSRRTLDERNSNVTEENEQITQLIQEKIKLEQELAQTQKELKSLKTTHKTATQSYEKRIQRFIKQLSNPENPPQTPNHKPSPKSSQILHKINNDLPSCSKHHLAWNDHLEYLKNVVISFSKHKQSRSELFPVIATILRISDAEAADIKQNTLNFTI